MKEHEKMSGNNPTRLKSSVSADLITKLCYGIERYTTVSAEDMEEGFYNSLTN